MKIALVTPPLLQVNTPYPATTYLTGALKAWVEQLPESARTKIMVRQFDASIALVLKLFSHGGVERMGKALPGHEAYARTIDAAVSFLQGKDPTLALRIVRRDFLPEGPRFRALENTDLSLAFGAMGVHDQAKHLASLYLDDLADLVRDHIDARFEFSRYGERLAASQASFDPLYTALTYSEKHPTVVDTLLDEVTDEIWKTLAPAQNEQVVVGMSAPFPGNVFCALRMSRRFATLAARSGNPIVRAFGGGYANTELRELKDARFFDFVDFVTLDDGEDALTAIVEHAMGARKREDLVRTFAREKNNVRYFNGGATAQAPQKPAQALPTTEGLPLGSYLQMLEMLNPMHRLWSEHRWNKLMLAHGCYWKKCTFCDTSLPYIKDYRPARVDALIAQMRALTRETGSRGFHFVDEAAPPALLRQLSEALVRENLPLTWWGNIRFEKSFTPELTALMAQAGCVAVTGGLEVASPRLLKLIQKGVTVEQVARVTHAFSQAGIFVHAYLIYGFPSQTTQETVDSLEIVRQLFAEGCLHSAFWHRFTATAHSPVGLAPKSYGIRLKKPKPGRHGTFAVNDIPFVDRVSTPHDRLGKGLNQALYNYMLGAGLGEDVRHWFRAIPRAPKTTVPKNWVRRALS